MNTSGAPGSPPTVHRSPASRPVRRPFAAHLPTLLLLTLAAAPAAAHDRTTSYSSWDIRGRNAQVTVRLSDLDVSHFSWGVTPGPQRDHLLGNYLTQQLQLLAGGTPCPVTDGPRQLEAPPGRNAVEWRVSCPADGALEIRSGILLDVAPSHLHFARVTRDGARPLERVLSDSERVWTLPGADAGTSAAAQGGTTLGGYVALGIEHILTGYDHLAFLLALLLIGGSFGEIAQVVTGFTVAHSITLGLTVLGYVRPDTAPVEALIGLSIALVAAENVWLLSARSRVVPCAIAALLGLLAVVALSGHGRVPALTLAGLGLFALCYFELLRQLSGSASLRWAIAFIFGLVHGFGFASVLGQAGLPADQLVHALFGFNLGVELGQLGVVALVWPIVRVAVRAKDRRIGLAVVELGSAAVLALGVFWFVTRTFG